MVSEFPNLVTRLGFDRQPTDLTNRSLTELVDLSGRVACVTGGGGVGLGHAIVDRLAAQGAIVAVADVDLVAAERSATLARERWNAKLLPVHCDVTDARSLMDMTERVTGILGPLDIFVNNVGGGGPQGPFPENSLEAIEAGVRLNLVSQLYGCHVALSLMVPRGKGVIINVASEGAKVGMPGLAVYNGCKAALVSFTRCLAHDVSRYGIRVNAVCPGIMLNSQVEERARSATPGSESVRTLEYAIDITPLGRGSLPEEVANVVAFLASDAASSVQGTAYSVGGGQGG